MRPIWTGAIGLWLVNIPVKMYGATQPSNLNPDMLDKKDHSRIKYMPINENTGKETDWENIVKGYQYNDNYVVPDDNDFREASAKNKHDRDIRFCNRRRN